MARDVYETLNDQLTNEVPQLIDLRVPYLDPSFEALVKIQLRCKLPSSHITSTDADFCAFSLCGSILKNGAGAAVPGSEHEGSVCSGPSRSEGRAGAAGDTRFEYSWRIIAGKRRGCICGFHFLGNGGGGRGCVDLVLERSERHGMFIFWWREECGYMREGVYFKIKSFITFSLDAYA